MKRSLKKKLLLLLLLLLLLISALQRALHLRGQNCKMRPLVSVIEASRRGRMQGNLEALRDPYWLFLLGGSLNTSKEAMTKILILAVEAPWSLRPWGKLPPLPLPLGGPALTLHRFPLHQNLRLIQFFAYLSSSFLFIVFSYMFRS